VAARFKKSREASSVRADGVVWSRISGPHHPVLRPPLLLLRRGAWNPYSVLVYVVAFHGLETIGFLRITAMFDERPVNTTLKMSTAVKNPPRKMVQREDLTKR